MMSYESAPLIRLRRLHSFRAEGCDLMVHFDKTSCDVAPYPALISKGGASLTVICGALLKDALPDESAP